MSSKHGDRSSERIATKRSLKEFNGAANTNNTNSIALITPNASSTSVGRQEEKSTESLVISSSSGQRGGKGDSITIRVVII